ncbi:Bifunctional oligoribonuclease and PAP phosphatase NrnA [Paenibacillus sp. CECT 9249]|nr:Bifunctional oligoribonuclease and PAP phosphatase NrnA [Paenibacillus sp. CECT 9249]
MNDPISLEHYERQLEEARQYIAARDDFLVVSHVQPDGDAASSTVAVGWLLAQLGKTFCMINEGSVPQRLSYLWSYDRIVNYAEQPPQRQFQNVICVDCADFARVGKVGQLFAEGADVLNIDHHPTNDSYGSVNLIKADAAATAEILFDLLKRFEIEWSLDIAEAIYTGLLTDTGGFRYSNTTPKVMAAASELLQYGVKGHQLADHLLEQLTMPHVLLLTKALSRLSFAANNKIGWIYVTPEDMRETGAVNDDLEGLVNYPRNIEGVEVGILFKQIDNEAVKVSMRSGPGANVAEIAHSLGGGGHVRAAGCKVYGALDDVIKQVIERVKQAL